MVSTDGLFRARGGDRWSVIVVGFLGALSFIAFADTRADAAESDEMRCRATIAKTVRTYSLKRHTVEAKCENRMVDLGACNHAKDARKLTNALSKMSVKIDKRCTSEHYVALGFLDVCDDLDGPPFTRQEAVNCLRLSHSALVDQLIALEYPGPPGPVDRETSHCADPIGRSRTYASRQLKARQRCALEQLRGKIPGTVDCKDAGDPATTGDAKTDAALAKSANQSRVNVVDGCDHSVLEDLGFPGDCTDADGPPFSLDDLVDCVRTTHADIALQMLDAEFL